MSPDASTPMASEPAAPYARTERHLRSALAGAELFPALAASRAGLEAGLDSLDRARERLHGSLWVLLLGGTGVGKSTLIGALAGREIAPTSVRRPTTIRSTFYAHRDADLTPLGEIPASEGEIVTHEIDALRDKVVIDPPDFDSAVEANRRRLMPLLEASDVVITVVDRQKYRDEALFDLLGRLKGEKTFIFVFNKLDLGVPEEVQSDLSESLTAFGIARPRILCLSALAVLEARRTGGLASESAGEFGELEEILRRELGRARIREIKAGNLGGLARNLVDRFGRLLGLDVAPRTASWLAECRQRAARAVSRMRSALGAVVFRRGDAHDALGGYLRALQLARLHGVFGVFMAVLERLASLLGRGWGRPANELEARSLAAARFASVEPGQIDLEISHLHAEASARLSSAGLDSEESRALVAPSRSGLTAGAVIGAAQAGVVEALSALTADAHQTRWYGLRSLACNLLPSLVVLAIPAYAGYALAAPIFGYGGPFAYVSISDAAVLGCMVLALVSFAQSLFVERSIRRGIGRAMTSIEERMARAIGAALEDGFARSCADLAARACACAREVEAARGALGDDGSGKDA